MKSILLSIKPEWVAKILNGEKTIEVRKKFPKDYVGWVYLYCSKNGTKKCLATKMVVARWEGKEPNFINGKVVARFWCDKVEEIYFEREVIGEICDMPMFPRTNSLSTQELIEKSCTKYLPYGETEIGNYLDTDKGFAIHISKLEIFDKPRELSEFYKSFRNQYYKREFGIDTYIDNYGVMVQPTKNGYEYTYKLTKAPQNYCYIEGE